MEAKALIASFSISLPTTGRSPSPSSIPRHAVNSFPIFRIPPNLHTSLVSVSSPSSSVTKHLSVNASSVIAASKEEMEITSSRAVGQHDLLIAGPGVLGRLVAQKWREEHPNSHIYGQTVTTEHHDELVEMGIEPSLIGTNPEHRFPYVIFCAPPSQSTDYPGDVRKAALSWNGEGSFLFTSSSAPYDCSDNGPCDEDTPDVPIGRSPRTDALLKAEKVALEFGGCVVRLAGLYNTDKGAHIYWLEKGTLQVRPDHILNLIHYEDAASLSVTIMKKKLRGRIFLGCDNHPVSRQDIMDVVKNSGKFSKRFQGFTVQCSAVQQFKWFMGFFRHNRFSRKKIEQLKDSPGTRLGTQIPKFRAFLRSI